LGVALHRTLSLQLGYRFLDVVSDEPTAELQRHRADLGLSWQPASWLSANVGYALWYQYLPHGAVPISPVLPGGAREDLANALAVAVDVRIRRWIGLFARYDFIFSSSTDISGRYQLDRVVAGVSVGWTFQRERLPPPPPLLPSVNGRDVTFRARARPGASVAVVGDWSQWQPQPLSSVGGDRWEGTFRLPPGRHAWALAIDGAIVTPTQAPGFVDDGFGGRNAIVDVP
ncbi:MAG TPA: glycogen-binding domain-containing protein, partial [Polyangia bacterium]